METDRKRGKGVQANRERRRARGRVFKSMKREHAHVSETISVDTEPGAAITIQPSALNKYPLAPVSGRAN